MEAVLRRLWRRLLPARCRATEWDFIAVGYPKTGNTWTRILLGRYVQLLYGLEETPLFDEVEQHRLRKGGYVGPAGCFTHEPLEWRSQTAQDLTIEAVVAPMQRADRTVLLVRHPLDTIVSSYMHSRYKDPISPFEGDIAEFVDHPVMGLEKLFSFYRLWEPVLSDPRRLLIWRYEDAAFSPVAQLARLVAFLGLPGERVKLEQSVAFASFDELRAREAQGRDFIYESTGFRAFGPGSRDDPNAFHVRRGVVGGYRDELPQDLIPVLEQRVREGMPTIYGYSR